MWLSKKIAEEEKAVPAALDGKVTVGGSAPAVLTDGESRSLALISPGGYFWLPDAAQEVLVLDGGYVVGMRQPEMPLNPGEICLRTGSAAIHLLPNGEIRLSGSVLINGERWSPCNDANIT